MDDVLDDVQETLLHSEDRVVRGASWFYRDFTCMFLNTLLRWLLKYPRAAFLGRDNVIEVALGLIIGAAFSDVVTSLVSDILLPPLTMISPNSRNLESHFLVLRKGDNTLEDYNTIEQAAADGKIPNPVNDFCWLFQELFIWHGDYLCKR
jgi:hypothetical protein